MERNATLVNLFSDNVSQVLPQLFEKDEREDGVRTEADEGWHVSFEKSQGSQLGRVRYEVEHVLKEKLHCINHHIAVILRCTDCTDFEFARFGIHGSRLQHIQRLGHRRRDRPLTRRTRPD